MALEPAYGVSTGSIADGAVTAAKLADPGGMPVGRRGAGFSGGGGGYATVSWAPTGDDFTIAVKFARRSIAGSYLAGSAGTATWRLEVLAAGAIRLTTGSGALQTANGVLDADDERVHLLEVDLGAKNISLDGVSLALVTNTADGSLLTHTATAIRIGSVSGGSAAQDWIGEIYDFKLIDPASTANSAYFPLDGKNSSGAYPNVWAVGASQDQGSTVANATVAGFVEDVLINSTSPGGGGAVRVGGPVVVMASRTTTQSFTSNGALVFTAAAPDPYGWWDGTSLVKPPVPGAGILSLTGRMRATALAGASAAINVRLVDSGTAALTAGGLTLDTVNQWVPVCVAIGIDISGTEDLGVEVIGLAAGDTIELDDMYLTLTAFPRTYAS